MRLLHLDHATGTICLTTDFHSSITSYSILSHRWGPDEVTLQELQDGTSLNKQGYDKIRFCGEQARRDGLIHFWVDTCCIDKKNAVKLQTAITSMFRWWKYTDTAVLTEPPWHSAFRNSLWFTRGWTLQVILAPTSVDFFTREHTLLGNKSPPEAVIWDITRIHIETLQNCPLVDFSVSVKFSWMEHRETTLEEDKAYAMLGIFSVRVPLMYGEGYGNASRRRRWEVSQATKLPPIPVAEGAAFDSRAEEHSARCYPDTRVDLLCKIESWAVDPDGKAIFWLNGIAGTGKSTIYGTVAQRFHEGGLLGASFFFKRDSFGHSDTDPDICSKALPEQFKQLILSALTHMRGPQTLVIVIDALDECDKDADIRVLIHLLSQVRAMPHEIVTHDLRIFFEIELTRIHEEYNDSSFEDHIDTLVRKAYPLFIITATMCRFLEPARFNPDDQLQKLLGYHATGPTSDQLESTYSPILNQLISEQTDVNKQRLLEGFRDIVGTIILLAEPLSARALSGILQKSLPDIQNQLKLLHSVLAVPSTSDGSIRTFHLSFRDFLLGPSRQDNHEFWIDEKLTHKKLAAQCIQLLSRDKIRKKDICNLCTSGVSLSQVDRQTINRHLPSEVQYACRYWIHHLESSGTSIQDNDQPGTCTDSFLHDANRFVRNCIHVIVLHPLQLYCSGICFTPQKRVIRQKFQKEMSAWIVVPLSMPDTWSACTQTLEGHWGEIPSIAISPDSLWLLSGSEDFTIKVWDLTMGTCTQTLEGHSWTVYSLAISPGSRWIVSGSGDGTIKIWDRATGTWNIDILDFTKGTAILTLGAPTGICTQEFTLEHVMGMEGCLPSAAFDSNTSLRTATGNISTSQVPCYEGYGIDARLEWIAWNGWKVMWLPFEYRPLKTSPYEPPQSAISGTTIAIGYVSRNVIVFQLSTDNSVV
ncbi:hypothetical protein F5Y03DRAFT_381307 [Xylaria venustula]|nr:hypothetical protein F5Y03DRAFT_381307 [Xylaria venustula]